MASVFLTGGNRGIGLEFARQYTNEGWDVVATCRQPDEAAELRETGAEIHQLDVTDHDRIRDLSRELDRPFDVVISNAGIYGGDFASQNFGDLDYDNWRKAFEVNTLGSVRVAEAFTPHLERGDEKKLVAITSKMGSIADASGGSTLYRSSKTALNMAMVAAAASLKSKGIAVGVLHPGWVQTDMGGENALISPEKSVRGLREVIAGLAPADKAHFRAFDGQEISW